MFAEGERPKGLQRVTGGILNSENVLVRERRNALGYKTLGASEVGDTIQKGEPR